MNARKLSVFMVWQRIPLIFGGLVDWASNRIDIYISRTKRFISIMHCRCINSLVCHTSFFVTSIIIDWKWKQIKISEKVLMHQQVRYVHMQWIELLLSKNKFKQHKLHNCAYWTPHAICTCTLDSMISFFISISISIWIAFAYIHRRNQFDVVTFVVARSLIASSSFQLHFHKYVSCLRERIHNKSDTWNNQNTFKSFAILRDVIIVSVQHNRHWSHIHTPVERAYHLKSHTWRIPYNYNWNWLWSWRTGFPVNSNDSRYFHLRNVIRLNSFPSLFISDFLWHFFFLTNTFRLHLITHNLKLELIIG